MSFGHVATEMVTISLPILLGWMVTRLGLMSEGFERENGRPCAVDDSIELVGQMTAPPALLLMGATIAHYRPLFMLTNWRDYVAALGRLALVPLAGMVMLRIFGVALGVVAVLVLESAMPVASSGTLYATQYGADTEAMMQGTFISIVEVF